MLLSALMNMDREQLRKIAAAAVARFAGMEPGRPVGGTYYLYRTLRQLDYDGLIAKMMSRAQEQQQNDDADDTDSLAERFQREEFEERLKVLRDLVESEIRRRSWPTGGPRRWRGRCASRFPKTSTSCTRPARRCSRCSGRSTR